MIPVLDDSRKNAAYKYFVEELAKCAKRNIDANRIRSNGHPERINEDDQPLDEAELKRKIFFLRQSPEDQEMLATFAERVRVSALHDVAALLVDFLSLDEMKISLWGQNVPASPYNMMHADLLGLLDGEKWEDEQ